MIMSSKLVAFYASLYENSIKDRILTLFLHIAISFILYMKYEHLKGSHLRILCHACMKIQRKGRSI